MHFVFLDEFGHIGPFVSRNHAAYRTSPVFGLAGYLIPDHQVRSFNTWFFKLKERLFKTEAEAAGKVLGAWEKKGSEYFTKGTIYKRKRPAFSLISQIRRHEGRIFYYGIEKFRTPARSSPDGLYSHILSKAILRLGSYFNLVGDDFIVILDEHQSRTSLLESALKTMYGIDRDQLSRLVQPPFQVESHLYDTIQAADWLATIIGTIWTYRTRPREFSDRQWAEKFFADKISQTSVHSTLRMARVARAPRLPLEGA